MPTVFLSPIGNGFQFLDANGNPLSGGMLNTYAAGTTTPTATYTSSAGNVANANPIILNSAGRTPSEVWLTAAQAYNFVLVDSSSSNPVSWDNLYGLNDTTTINGLGYTGATVSGAFIMNAAPINEARAGSVPVATQINLTNLAGNYAQLTGSGTITALQIPDGAERLLVSGSVSAAFQNSTTLIMVAGASVTVGSGDILGFRGEASGIVRNVLYQPAYAMATAVKIISANYTLSNGNTTLPVSGAGFRPRLARLALGFGTTSNAGSIGETDGSNSWCLYNNNGAAAGQSILSQGGFIGAAILNGIDTMTFSLAAFNNDGLTFTTLKNGTPTGVVNLSFTFIR